MFIPPAQEQPNEEPQDEDFEIFDPSTDPTLTNGVKYAKDFIVFEPETTESDLGLWVVRTKGETGYYTTYDGSEPINNSYLEFTGNNLNGGAATSPIEFTFKATKTAKFRIIMRMLQPLESCTPGSAHCSEAGYELGDKRNDLWLKLEGNYTTACAYPTSQLKSNHKFWGRGVRKWGSLIKLESHVEGNKVQQKVAYNLIKGETYTLTLSGRAQGCSIDYIVFYDESATSGVTIDTHSDPIVELPSEYKPDEK
ncbi:hypothetical protein [Wenyingzhuangia sp. IMCC45574]